MTLLETIDQIEADRKAARLFPFHALVREIKKVYGNGEEVRNELNRLYIEGKIKVGRTINDKYVHVAGRSYNE
jgi:hypothetical protein